MKRNEQGIALVITLFLMATLSALAVSMMFLAQTETAASRNYRTMSQARYGAEAGVHAAANYLMSASYPAPTLANYDTTKSPVTCINGCTTNATAGAACSASSLANAVQTGCVVLSVCTGTCDSSSVSKTPSNYPDSTVVTAFRNAASGTLAVNPYGVTNDAGRGTVTYGTAAVLTSMKQITVYGGAFAIVQTWQIISDGAVPPSTAAIVEVSSTIEQEVGFATTYAVFATNPLCGAITISGNAATNSYNSALLTSGSSWTGGSVGSGTPNVANTGGGVGTNGNLNVGGSVAIGGTLSTPRTGAGTCSNSSVDAITGNGSWTYGGTRQLSQAVVYPPPANPTTTPPTTAVSISSGDTLAACNLKVSGSGWTCAISGHTVTLKPATSQTLTLGNVSVASNTDLVIAGAATNSSVTLNVNSFNIGNNATLSLADGSVGTMPKANMVMNIAGQSLGATLPLDLSGGGGVNTNSGVTGTTGYNPSRLLINYGGTAEIDTVGNNSIAATIYAPSALVKTVGNGSLYGSVLASTFTDTGGATINYDSNMSTAFAIVGNYMLTSFSWKKY